MKDPVLMARPFERLSRLDGYKVEGHHVDPRGWTIINTEGRSIGEVKDLIIDTDRMAAAFLDVELDTKWFDLHDDPHVFIPMHRAERDGEHRRLRVDGLSRERIAALVLARDAHQREFWRRWWDESATARTAAPGGTPSVSGQAAHDELQRAIGTIQPGETVRIPVMKEEIVVERRPVADANPVTPEDVRPVEPRATPPRAL